MADKKSRSKNVIHNIAHCLVKSHLRVSLESSEWRKVVNRGVLNDGTERRVIVVVGSGASQSVGLPLASEALDILKKDAIMPSKAIDAELDRLSQIYKLDRKAFETNLRALSSSALDAQKLRDNLQKMYGHQFMPVLGYEILAHMLKHRFLDAIINFNFDELLDQSIEDELDRGEYHHILSDGDCPDDSKLREDNSKLPFYIKPHGTASHKSTLRFTREDYYELPLDIQRILRYLLTDKPVVLLVIGFRMQSLELNRILEDAKPGSMIYHLNRKKPVVKFKSRSIQQNILVDSRRKGGVNRALLDIWKSVHSSFRKEYRPRDVGRHILVSETFSQSLNDHNTEAYLRGRTTIEICLSIAKGKGLVNMSQLSGDRSGKYFDHYKAINNNANFYEMCKQIGLKDIGYSREAMRLMKDGSEDSKILNRKDFQKEIGFLYERVLDNLDPFSRSKLSKELFRKTLISLYNGQEVELRYRPHSPYTKIFRAPKPILTTTAFKFYTEQIFKLDWKYLLLVAETGEWLAENSILRQIKAKAKKNPSIRVFLIVADNSWKQKLIKKYGKLITVVRELPWWEHNRHMTILIDSNRTPFTSIYFSRRLRSANITPVLLTDVNDSVVVLESFNAYWLKSVSVNEKKKIYDWIKSSEARDFDKLFKLLETGKFKK